MLERGLDREAQAVARFLVTISYKSGFMVRLEITNCQHASMQACSALRNCCRQYVTYVK